MVALSRLKATFEACPGLFSPKHRLASREGVAWRNRAATWGALSHFQRCQRYVYSMKIGLRKIHERGYWSPQSACPMHAGNLVLKRGENKLFRDRKWRWLGQRHMDRPGVICEWCHSQVFPQLQRWLLWILCEHSKPQPAWCAMPLLLYSTEHLHSFTGCKSCGHSPFWYEDIIMDHGWSVPGTTSLPCLCSLRKCFSQNWPHGKKVESGGDRIHLICHIGQVLWRWFFSSSLHLQLLSELSPYSEPHFQVSSRLHSRLCGEQRDASLQSLPRQKCWCVRGNCI